jgi:PRC-barrel domain
MDHSMHTPLTGPELNADNLIGAPIYGTDGEKIGTISHLHTALTPAKAVVDVGGFLGIGSKPVLVELGDLDIMRDADGKVHGLTSWTKDQLGALPEHYE